MRFYTIFLAIAIIILSSCEDDPPLPRIVSEVKAFDLDNNGNGSDIRVDFSVINNQEVKAYRVMIVPAKDSSSFNTNIAKSIPEQSYTSVSPQSFQLGYSVNRLPAGFLDVNGAAIVNDVVYVSVILVEKNSDFQLSGFSRPFTLQDQGIYIGHYWIGRNTDCGYIVTGLQQDVSDFPADGSLYIDLFSNTGKYYGLSQCGPGGFGIIPGSKEDICEFANLEGSLEFTLTGMQVENFALRLLNGKDCPVYVSGTGVIEDDIFIAITATAERCTRTCNETWTFVRQY